MRNSFIIFAFLVFNVIMIFTSCNKTEAPARYEGEDISQHAEIIRDKSTKAASLKINTEGKWTLFSGSSVENIDFSKPLLEGNGSGTFPLAIPDSVRSYFQLITDKGRAILSERHLPMAGGYNFRDLGGYKNKEGKYVKWGKIFRSDDLYHLTSEDLNYLANIPVKSVVDFRSAEEVKKAPDKVPSSAKEYAYSITPGNLDIQQDISSFTAEAIDSVMMSINRMLVTDPSIIKLYKDFFALLQDQNDVPLLFHCTAGKDRTGMGAALILYALGVDEETIFQDYLASNFYLDDKYAQLKQDYPEMASMFEVKRDFLQSGIEQIKKDHGSVENYLKNSLNVDLDKFKEMYLY